MNLKGSHLLYLILILFGNYLLYTNKTSDVFLTLIGIQYVVYFIIAMCIITYGTPDYRMFDDPEEAKRRYESKYDETRDGRMQTFNFVKALKYSGNIFFIIFMIPIIPFILFSRVTKYLDNHLSLKA